MPHPLEPLLERNPIHVQRRELEAAGVPVHTIDALYPDSGFNGFLPLVTNHLRAIGTDHLRQERRKIKKLGLWASNTPMSDGSQELQLQRATDFAAWDQHAPAVNEFTDLTKSVLSGKPQKIKSGGKVVVLGGEAFYAYLLGLTHHCWWTMLHERQLPPSWQAKSREMSDYLGHDILLLTSPA